MGNGPSVRATAAVVMDKVAEESTATDNKDESRNAVETDLRRPIIELTETEAARERSDVAGFEEGAKDEESGGNDKLDEGKDGKGADTDENENEVSGGGNSGDSTFKLESYNQTNNRRRINYQMRADAGDCAFYMKFGSCKFGPQCKFNHPPRRKNQGLKERSDHKDESPGQTRCKVNHPPRRKNQGLKERSDHKDESPGQTRCKYYLTSEGCKFGSKCKYYHGTDKLAPTQALEFNFLGLPIRPGKKECPYYMRTGSCKYDSTCRLHHPEPTTVGGGDSIAGYGNDRSLPSWSSQGPSNETFPYVPIAFPPTQSAPTSHPHWNGHKAASNRLTESYLTMQHQNNMTSDAYPERPGEPECSFFMKTGDCKFNSSRRFHHPHLQCKDKPDCF